jgi:hypothetical protein
MIANEQFAPDRYERALAAIHALITERKIGRYALFHEVGEGQHFPDDSEEMSGYVVNDKGEVYTFWTGWDTEHGHAVFTTWERITPEPSLAKSREYLDARAEVGLPPLPNEPHYARVDGPDGVTRFVRDPVGVAAVMIMAIVLGVERFVRIVRRKLP